MFKGLVTIKVTENNRVVKKITKHNIVNKRAVERLLNDGLKVFDSSCKICLSTNTPAVDFEKVTIDNVVAIGNDNLTGVTGRVFSEATDTEPRQVSFHNRFLFPNAQRSIGSIAVIPSGTSNDNVSNSTEDIYCYLSLDVPLVQETNQVIDIFYKLYLDWSGETLNQINPSLKDVLDYLFLGKDFASAPYYKANQLQSVILEESNGEWDKLPTTTNSIVPTGRNASSSGYDFTPVENSDANLFKKSYSVTADLNSLHINQHLYGLSTGRLEGLQAASRKGLQETFKNTGGVTKFNLGATITPVYSQSATSISLLYNPNSLATSDWKPVISTDNSHHRLPTIYSLQVENAGGVGVGSYSLWKTNYSGRPDYISRAFSADYGSDETDWVQRPMPLVQTSLFPYLIKSDRDKNIPFNDKWIYPWKNDRLWVSADKQTVAIWSIYPEFIVTSSWDLGADINDVATYPQSDRIYVATESGLIEIDPTNNTTTTLSTDKAKAVDCGDGGAVFAVLVNGTSDRLASSLNPSWADAEDTTGVGITDWNKVIFIRVDRSSTDYKLGILEHRFNPRNPLNAPTNLSGEWFSKVHFWSRTNGYSNTIDCLINGSTAVTYHQSTTHPYNSSFIVKDGIWVFPVGYRARNFSAYGYVPGININFTRKLLEDPGNGVVIITQTGDIEFIATNVATLAECNLCAVQFDTILRKSTYDSSTRFIASMPSVALINTDITSGYITLAVGGYLYSTTTLSNYGSNQKLSCVGLFDLAVDDTNPETTTEIRAYKDTDEEMKYIFGYWNDGGAIASCFAMSGNLQVLESGGIINFTGDRLTQANNYQYLRSRYRGNSNPTSSQRYHPITISTWGSPYIEDRINPEFAIRYGWDDVAASWVQSDILPGKPLHTASEGLIDGLSIGWQDLNPGNTADLVAGQFYNFIDIKAQGIVNDGSFGSFSTDYSFYLRPVKVDVSLSGTITSNSYIIPEATSDNLWLCLDYTDLTTIEIAIAGYGTNATIIDLGVPNPNEIKLVDAVTGELEFNPADDGKTISGQFLYLQKIHETEVL